MASLYYSGQGKVYAAARQGSGDAGVFRYLGNCSAVKVVLSTSTKDHKESYSGGRVTDQRLVTETKAEVSVDMEEFLADNLAMGLYGVKAALAPGAQANESFPNPVAVGDYVRTKYPPNGAAIVIKDSPGTATLVAGVDYNVINPKTGLIQILSVATGVQPYKFFSYTPAAGVVNIPMLSTTFVERWVRVELTNTADPALGTVLVELYKTVFDPIDMDLISDDFSKFPLKGQAYFDSTKVADAQLANFGRVATM